MVLMPLLSRLLTLLVILTMPLFLARLTLIPIKSLSICFRVIDRKSGSAGMPRPSSYAVFCLKKKTADRCRYFSSGRSAELDGLERQRRRPERADAAGIAESPTSDRAGKRNRFGRLPQFSRNFG